MGLNVADDTIKEMKDLIDAGDLSLEERRKTFEKIKGRATTLSDEQLIKAIAATDDDDDDLFCTNVCIVEDEQTKPTLAEHKASKTAA